MKNYKVRATRKFLDSVDHVERKENEIFECTEERYNFLKEHNAVELVGVQKTVEEVIEEEVVEEAKEETVEEKPVKKTNNKKKSK